MVRRARWLELSEVLIDETLDIDIWSIRFEPKRRTGSEGLWQVVATSWLEEFVFPARRDRGACGSETSLLTAFIARDAKLFTIGCEELSVLSSPLVNNFGEAIRARGLAAC
jgi:hypothetical protein